MSRYFNINRYGRSKFGLILIYIFLFDTNTKPRYAWCFRYESEIASLSSKLQEVSDEHVSKCGEVAVLHREKLEQLNKLSMLQKEEGEAGELKVRLVALQEQLQVDTVELLL